MNNEIKEINIKIPGQILDYVDTKEHLLDLFNYITNLQQENERLNTCIDDQERVINSLIDKRNLYKINYNDYKSRCEKAIEYIKENAEEYLSVDMYYHLNDIPEINDILNILQNGSDKE